ncbi:MAG TPA: MFS transporter, partial [Casimicrobiaceae bacterium]|nr:MFS transporter [Casimicrobiaceae bacterium]
MKPANAGVALAATLAIQIYVSLVATAPAVLAPEIATTFAIAPKWVGVFVSLVYVGAMFASLASGGFIERHGAIRVSQACVVLCLIGAWAVALAPERAAALLVVIALVIGIGYGPITPASSHVLIRTATPSNLALTFSIKQTGVPAGAALAGALLPGLALAFGWRHAFVAMAVIGLLVVATAQGVRPALDADRADHGQRFSPARVFAPLALVRRSRALTELTLIALFYAATQACLVTFLVVYLTEALGWTLIAAGLALTVTTVAGATGRIVWGLVADRLLPPRMVLAVLGIVAGACSLVIATAHPEWPVVSLLAVAAVFGGTAIGWNGVQLAEVARHAPAGAAGLVTGASGFITFSGVVAGPPLFALLAALTGSYRAGFVLCGLMSGLGGMALLVTGRR